MSNKPEIIMPTDEEDEAINRGIAADPDTYEVSDEGFKKMKPLGARGRRASNRPRCSCLFATTLTSWKRSRRRVKAADAHE